MKADNANRRSSRGSDALSILMSQHEEVDELIEKIEGSDDPDEKSALFQTLADKIAAHSTIEEKLFYPSVMSDETQELLLEFTEEHLVVKRTLADMLELDADDERFDAKLAVVKEALSHHAHVEEEAKLFPVVRKLLSADELEALGGELLALSEFLLEHQPRQQIPAETREAARL
jgi:hemerythrin superfamily protein